MFIRKTLILLFISNSFEAEERSILDGFNPLYRIYKLAVASFNVATTEGNLKMLRRIGKLQEPVPENASFPCTVGFRSEKVPNSAHQLRPGDIDVVGALGDSLTAGFGLTATNLFNLLPENRGRAFSIGGQGTWRTYLTLPNILKEFNPKLIGYSLRTAYSIERASQFNVAEGGAVSKNMPYMTKVLIKRMKCDRRVNIKKDWKMITLLIGDNDFCTEMCYADLDQLLENHKQDLLEVLRLLKKHLPRTIVNVIPPFHLRALLEMKNKPPICHLTHSVECPCMFDQFKASYLGKYSEFMIKWQQLDLDISNSAEFDLDDFTVIPHLFSLNYSFPLTPSGDYDLTYLSADCFHFSQKGNALVANDLWNSIMEPFGHKSNHGFSFMTDFFCPSIENPFIFTRRNSG